VYNQFDQNTSSHTNFSDSYSDTTGKGNITLTENLDFSTNEINVFICFNLKIF
jgi:hypothetical protein